MDKAAFEKMKKSAIFLNLGRGPIVNESDLAQALMDGELAAAGLDVLAQEARTNLMHIIYSQIEDFFTN